MIIGGGETGDAAGRCIRRESVISATVSRDYLRSDKQFGDDNLIGLAARKLRIGRLREAIEISWMENNSTYAGEQKVIDTELQCSDMNNLNVLKSLIQPCEICIYMLQKFYNVVIVILLFIKEINILLRVNIVRYEIESVTSILNL